MKKLICILSAILITLSFASCSGGTNSKSNKESDSDIAAAQALEKAQFDLLGVFGVTIENERIVAFKETQNYIDYIVVRYENGKKTSEKNYIIFYYADFYETQKDNYKNEPGVEFNDKAATVSFNTNLYNSGNYNIDLDAIQKQEYILRAP